MYIPIIAIIMFVAIIFGIVAATKDGRDVLKAIGYFFLFIAIIVIPIALVVSVLAFVVRLLQ